MGSDLPGYQNNIRGNGATWMKYAFRTASQGAPGWILDAPVPTNGGTNWTQDEKDAVKSAVTTYKNKVRPILRNADVYHLTPRPDGTIWYAFEYYKPEMVKGVVYVFKPNSSLDTQTLKLKGLDAKLKYKLTFEDGTNNTIIESGETLMNTGGYVALPEKFSSELILIEKN